MNFLSSIALAVKVHLLPSQPMPAPISVNYFPHRKCNYACEFCFHTTKNLDILPIEKAKHGLRLLAEAGMRKLNISGGEPFLQPKFIGEIFKFCKEELRLESCTVVNNGSKVTEAWLDKYGQYLDIMALSVDSFDAETNIQLGRADKTGNIHARRIFQVAEWCRVRGIKVKLNSVITKLNWEEDMHARIEEIQPFRWKVFQVLLLDGENTGQDTSSLRDARDLVITHQQFQSFLDRHHDCPSLVPEDNEAMKDSYLNLDEHMCFLNCLDGGKTPGRSLLDVGVREALKDAGWDETAFRERGGIFDWSREEEVVPESSLDW
ncbi:hypothetical protein DL96DRAFT_1607554 [Flagelloscypha sp. PMI_526]|nr:hypothetical protein DL96DRAFT_1607554 [Flagelloscypha sp. PMI_526]